MIYGSCKPSIRRSETVFVSFHFYFETDRGLTLLIMLKFCYNLLNKKYWSYGKRVGGGEVFIFSLTSIFFKVRILK